MFEKVFFGFVGKAGRAFSPPDALAKGIFDCVSGARQNRFNGRIDSPEFFAASVQ
jgi:hypothetical protein